MSCYLQVEFDSFMKAFSGDNVSPSEYRILRKVFFSGATVAAGIVRGIGSDAVDRELELFREEISGEKKDWKSRN